MKPILITGSDGFLGQHLFNKLYLTGAEIICVDKAPIFQRTIKLDVAHKMFIEYFVFHKEGFDYVFHFGSPCSIIQFNKDPMHCVGNTMVGFRQTLRIAERSNAKFIYPSSGNVYGCQDDPHKETLTPKPTNLYGACKWRCEELAKKSMTETVGLRIYAGYGALEEKKGNIASVICLFLTEMMQDKAPVIWGDGFQTRDFIYIDDVIKGIIAAASLRWGIINLGSGKAYSFNEVVEIINEVLGKNIAPKYVAKPKNYVNNAHADTFLMKKLLELNPMSLEEGIRNFHNYLKVKP